MTSDDQVAVLPLTMCGKPIQVTGLCLSTCFRSLLGIPKSNQCNSLSCLNPFILPPVSDARAALCHWHESGLSVRNKSYSQIMPRFYCASDFRDSQNQQHT